MVPDGNTTEKPQMRPRELINVYLCLYIRMKRECVFTFLLYITRHGMKNETCDILSLKRYTRKRRKTRSTSYRGKHRPDVRFTCVSDKGVGCDATCWNRCDHSV